MTLSVYGLLTTALATALGTTAASADALPGKPSSADILAASTGEDWRALDPENTLYIETPTGRVTIALSTVLGTPHAERMKALAREGFYDGLSFYRVIEGFVAQGGDAFETKESANKEPLAALFEEPAGKTFDYLRMNDRDGYAKIVGFAQSLPVGFDPKTKTAWHLHCTGALALGRGDARDTASTEFYVTLQPQRYLDRNMTVFGRVVDGMEHLQALKRVAPPQSPDDDLGDAILSVRVAADVPSEQRSDFEILRSDRPVFAQWVESRRNRPEAFFHFRPDFADVCALAVPVRRAPAQ